jgi:hypothetical protein
MEPMLHLSSWRFACRNVTGRDGAGSSEDRLRETWLEYSEFRHFSRLARVSHSETHGNSRIVVTGDRPQA